MLVPINITGGTDKHKSLPLTGQVTRNFWPQLQDNDRSQSKYILESWVGKKLFVAHAGADRGMLAHKGVLYKVSGDTLYSVAANGIHTSLGNIGSLGRCVMLGVTEGILVVTGGVVYLWDGATLTVGSDPDLGTPNAATFINGKVIYDTDDETGEYGVSNVGDSLNVDGLNYGTAESNADKLKRPYAFNQVIEMFGEASIEPYYDSGTGNPPIDRIEGGLVQGVGLAALHSTANNKDYLYFLGSDLQVYALQGSTNLQPVSNKNLTQEFYKYSTISDAIGWCMQLKGQWFYTLTFPTQSKSWLYPEGGEWFEWSTGIHGERDRSNSYAYCYGKHLVADYENGNIYELDFDTYTDAGDTIVRVRRTAPLHGGLANAPGKTMEMNKFSLYMETGTGLIEGQGSDPVVLLSFSDDGGKTWSTPLPGNVGKLGEFQLEVSWFCLGSFKSRVIEITTSDPVYYSIYDASAEIEVGI